MAGKPIPEEQRATKKLQIYVTPYTHQRLEAIKERTGKAVSGIARQLIEEGLGLRERSRAKINRRGRPLDVGTDALERRVRELMDKEGQPGSVARRIAAAEQRAVQQPPG